MLSVFVVILVALALRFSVKLRDPLYRWELSKRRVVGRIVIRLFPVDNGEAISAPLTPKEFFGTPSLTPELTEKVQGTLQTVPTPQLVVIEPVEKKLEVPEDLSFELEVNTGTETCIYQINAWNFEFNHRWLYGRCKITKFKVQTTHSTVRAGWFPSKFETVTSSLRVLEWETGEAYQAIVEKDGSVPRTVPGMKAMLQDVVRNERVVLSEDIINRLLSAVQDRLRETYCREVTI